MEWLQVLQHLSLLLVYVVPGYSMLEAKNLLLPARKKETLSRFLESVLLSYLILGFVEGVRYVYFLPFHKPYSPYNVTEPYNGLILVGVGVGLGVVTALVIRSPATTKMLGCFSTVVSYHPSVWNQVLDGSSGRSLPPGPNEKSVYVRVYLEKDQVIYDGFVSLYTTEPDSNEREIYLIGYRCFTYERKKLEDNWGDWKAGVLLGAERISRLEFPDLTRLSDNSDTHSS